MKVVLDTNVFISGIFWKGVPNKIILAWRQGKFTLVTSLEAIKELIKVLKDFKIGLPDELIKGWVDLIVENSELVMIEKKLKVIKEDPDDDVFIETALVGNAKFIVSQDKHLLKLKEFEKIKIITPSEFLRLI